MENFKMAGNPGITVMQMESALNNMQNTINDPYPGSQTADSY